MSAMAAADSEERITAAIESLADKGFVVIDDLVPTALVARLAARLAALESAGELSMAAVGREGDRQIDSAVRHASIRWLDGSDDAERELLDLAERLRVAINRQFLLGLFHFECNFIAYPVGGFYKRHIDSLAGARNRVVSFVLYLDPDWRPEYGGRLGLWGWPTDKGPPGAEILPQAGRVVLMLSEQIPHEVQPAHRPRHAIAGWWRVATA